MIDYSRPSAQQVARAAALSLLEPHGSPRPDATRPPPSPSSKRMQKVARLPPQDIHAFVASVFADDLHAKRVLSLANGVLGVLHSASLAIHAIGQGLAQARGLDPKHAVKQVDRMLRNDGYVLHDLAPLWAGFVLGQRTEVVVTLDWTDFDADDHATLCLNLVTSHGRATPLVWKTVPKAALKNRRNDFEDELLECFHDLVPWGVKVTLLADRAFGDQKLYQLLRDWGFDFVIRFRGCITVTFPDGVAHRANELIPQNGRPVLYRDVKVTADRTAVAGVVCVHARGMKEAWHLATSRTDLSATKLVRYYGRRFSTEENFRDTKDPRFGLGLSATHIGDCAKRDRLLLLAAMAEGLLTLLGAACEEVGLDKRLKVNTAKKRTHSLFRQGLYWYGAIATMPEERLRLLMDAFGTIVSSHPFFAEVFGFL